jgi:hypothetical protein
MSGNMPEYAPTALREAFERARANGTPLIVGVVHTPESEYWETVDEWHTDSAELLRKKFSGTAELLTLCPGRMALFSTALELREMDHNMRSALGFADLPTRLGTAAMDADCPSADALLLQAFISSKK